MLEVKIINIYFNRAGRKPQEAPSASNGKNEGKLEITSILILNGACQSAVMMELAALKIDFVADCCNDFFKKNFFDSTDNIIVDTKVSKKLWANQRKFRITGSRVYEIYTYKGQDWSKKAFNYFYPKSFTNRYVAHGLEQEEVARRVFGKSTGLNVVECGLVVSDFNPWLGYSPDGIITDEKGNPKALLEIKCPFSGNNS